MHGKPLSPEEELGAFADAGFLSNFREDEDPRHDVPPPDETPASADGEPIHKPTGQGTAEPEGRANGSDKASATAAAPEILPLDTFDASRWEGVPIEPRRWIAHNRIPVGEPGIMSGDGGTGKTKLALQLRASVNAELPDWVGGLGETHGPLLVFSAEEKLTAMYRRSRSVP